MPLKTESTFPNRRTYVLKLRNDASPSELVGRIENFVTGSQCEFASGPELLQSIATDLSASSSERPADEDNP